MSVEEKISVAVLGATGLVGEKVIELLRSHPKFTVGEVAASNQRKGEILASVGLPIKDPYEIQSKFVISALPSSVAQDIELALLEKGAYIFSNASTFRMKEDVPILIPEINLAHLKLLNRQKTRGKIVTNANCVVAFVAPVLAPLQNISPIRHVHVVTQQAISGAGKRGVFAFDVLGNLIPHIEGESEKIIQETKKILGTLDKQASFSMSVQVTRIPVQNGHTAHLEVEFETDIALDEVEKAYSSPPYKLYRDIYRPQPRLDLLGEGMTVHIGKLKMGGTSNRVQLMVMGDNLMRGAAGGSLYNLETTYRELFSCASP